MIKDLIIDHGENVCNMLFVPFLLQLLIEKHFWSISNQSKSISERSIALYVCENRETVKFLST